MLISLLCTDSYNSFNIELAHLFGLHESIYLNELININEKAIRKGKVEEGFFSVDRNYIFKRTTLQAEEQREIDRALSTCGIVAVDQKDVNKITIDLSKLTSMLMEGNEKFLNGFSREIKNRTKQSKAEIIRNSLKQNIKATNPELRNAYSEWIDSVSMKRGYMSKKAVLEGEALIDSYCNRDLDMALKIISIATIHSYVDMNWALNDFKKDYSKTFKKPPAVIQSVTQLSNEVF